VVIAGLGSSYRSDDGVGPRVAAQAADACAATLIGPYADPLDLLGAWDGADLAVIVDATRSGAEPGTLREVELDVTPSTAKAADAEGVTSTHGIGLAGVVRLALAVGRAPTRVVLLGVEGETFTNGDELSPAVEAAVGPACARIVELVDETQPCA
jgi:hydrogenase maturation protease